jgi:hypothetical protein
MGIEQWIGGFYNGGGGQSLSWASAFSTEINSLASGNAVISTVSITNTKDIFCDISYVAGATVTTAAPNNLAFYLYPLNEDGSTYGDGRFGSSAAGPPPSNYFAGSIGFAAAAGTTIAGVVTGIIIPPGTFSFVLMNNAGVQLAASSTCKFRTYNRAVF